MIKKRSRKRYKAVNIAVCMTTILLLSACGSVDDVTDALGKAVPGNSDGIMSEQGSSDAADAEEKKEDKAEDGAKNKAENKKEEPTATLEPSVRDMHDELEEELEEKVRALYEQRLLLREAVRTIVAEKIRSTAFVTVDPKEQFSVMEVMVDEVTGNPVVSEGVKEFLRAASDGKSIQEMCRAALEGSASQIPDYLAGTMKSSLQDAVTSLIGIDVFTPVSVISQWINPDQEPTALLQGIVEEQQKDVSSLMLFMQQEEISAADIYKVAQMMYAVELRAQEISAAQGGIREYSGDVEKLRRLAEQYVEVDAQLAVFAEMKLPNEVPEFNEEDRSRLSRIQSDIGVQLDRYESLYYLSIGNLSANYDVEGFREAQKEASQEELVENMIFGSLIGGIMSESGQILAGQIQENRREFCDMLTDFMEESYVEVVGAQGTFMKQYNILLHMMEATDKELYFADIYMVDHEYINQLDEAARAYLVALSRYMCDLDNASFLYNCILSSRQVSYLFDLQIEIDTISQTVASLDSVWNGSGYDNDEVLERWNRLVDCYVESVSYIVERGAVMGETPGLHANGEGKYDGINYHVYTKEFTAESRPVLITGGGRSYYYDMDGYLICMDAADARITGRSFYVLSYLSKEAGAEIKTFWADLESPEIQRMYEQSLKAQELYSYFWGGGL